MNILSRLKILLPSISFECYYLIWYVTYFARDGCPENFLWLVSFFIKTGLGYLVYRLYVSPRNKIAILGPSLVLAVVIVVYIIFFVSPDVLSPVIGGYGSLLLSANSFFLFRYSRHPDIIIDRINNPDYPIKRAGVSAISTLIIVVWATIEILTGTGSGLLQLGVLFFWIGFHVIIEFSLGIKAAYNK
jgi:hypothetical protein